jgi:hypothetical protein
MIGTQPILRYVRDETRVGKHRDHSIAYWYHYFYTKYTGNVNEFMFNRTMDVTDSYLWGESLEHGRVNADRWSINAWTDYNQIRRKVYEYADCMTIPYNYKNHAYDTQAHKWLNKRYYTAIPPYISSVYWEPIIIVAYMEIDDDDQLIFKSKYGNKKYTLISNPIDDNYEMAITSHPDILRKVIDPYTFVNEEPKTGYIYCW